MRRIVLVALVAACGASAPPPAAAVKPAAGAASVSPEKYAELAAYFQKKRPLVVTCYNNAITNRKLSEKAQGRVTLMMQITAAGRPQGVRVSDSTLASPDVDACLVDLVSKWEVPAPGADTDFTFAYEFQQD
jgi:TonB family protein